MCVKRLPESRATKSHGGFTMLEMLVVLAILTILGALLFGSFRKGLEASKRSACLSNLRNFGVAVFSYANDHSGELPMDEALRNPSNPLGGRVRWRELLAPYIGFDYTRASQPEAIRHSLFACPAETESVNCYAMNVDLNHRLYGEAARVMQVALHNAPTYVFLCDSYKTETLWNQTGKILDWTQPNRRHGGHPNFLYADGHAAPFMDEICAPAEAPADRRESYNKMFYVNGIHPSSR